MKKWSSVCLSLLIGVTLFAQPLLVDIDFDKIPQRKVRAFITTQIENSAVFFSDLEPSCKKNSLNPEFNHLEHIFRVDLNVNEVWQAYKNSSMAKAWNSRRVSFGVLFNKWSDSILYTNEDDYSQGVDTGQVFFLNLKIFSGIYNLAVGMEIIEVDSVRNEIQFSYLQGGKSEGAQTIRLIEESGGKTKIIHTSSFRSESHFRDRRLYPFFHDKLITEFHENILKDLSLNRHALVLLDKNYQLN
jgi:hypothetical protein